MNEFFIDSAEEYMQLGQTLEARGDLQKAETAFLNALRITAGALEKDYDSQILIRAKELCLILADLNMQQGNMHGADIYYVKAMQYSEKETAL